MNIIDRWSRAIWGCNCIIKSHSMPRYVEIANCIKLHQIAQEVWGWALSQCLILHTHTLPNSTPHWCYGTYQHRLATFDRLMWLLLWFKTLTSNILSHLVRGSSHLPAASGCIEPWLWWLRVQWSLVDLVVAVVFLGGTGCPCVPGRFGQRPTFGENDGWIIGAMGDGEVPQLISQHKICEFDIIWYII